MLYAGTDNAAWVTLDDGANWTKLRLDMPPAPVYWLVVQERFDDLVVATYGRGFYILDDLGSLRALDEETLARLVEFGGNPAQRKKFVLDANQSLAVDSVLKVLQAAATSSEQTISTSMTRMLSKMAVHAGRGSP